MTFFMEENIRDQISCLSSVRLRFCCYLLKVHLLRRELRLIDANIFCWFISHFFINVCYSMSKRSFLGGERARVFFLIEAPSQRSSTYGSRFAVIMIHFFPFEWFLFIGLDGKREKIGESRKYYFCECRN